MSDATYNSGVYKDLESDRLVVSTCGRLQIDGGVLQYNVREAAICASCGDLPFSGHVFVGNSSAAIVHYVLPTPDARYVGSVLAVHAIAFDGTINSSTHWYVETSSGNSYGLGMSTGNCSLVFDSTYEQAFTFYVQMASTNLYKVALPGTTGALATELTIGTTVTT
jgi:hypothetical protein